MTTPRQLGPHDEPQQSGAIVAIHHGDYRRQQVFVASGANIGIWYCLGGEYGRVKVVDDQRNHLEQLGSKWRQPSGTIPQHPHWEDLLALGPVTLLVPGNNATYDAGWRAGRRDLWNTVEALVYDGPPADTQGEQPARRQITAGLQPDESAPECDETDLRLWLDEAQEAGLTGTHLRTIAEVRRLRNTIANVEGANDTGICDCSGYDSVPISPITGKPIDHHCDCTAVSVAAILLGDRRLTRHAKECSCGHIGDPEAKP